MQGAGGNSGRSAAQNQASRFAEAIRSADQNSRQSYTDRRNHKSDPRSSRSNQCHLERLKNDGRAKAVADAGKSLDKKIIEVEEALIQTKAKSGQDVLNFPIRLNNQLAALGGEVGSADSAPTHHSYQASKIPRKATDDHL